MTSISNTFESIFVQLTLLVYTDSEIASHETRLDGSTDISKDETVMRESTGKPDESNVLGSCHEDFNPKHVIRRLQHMKLELSSVLDSLMFHADEVVSQKKVTPFLSFFVFCFFFSLPYDVANFQMRNQVMVDKQVASLWLSDTSLSFMYVVCVPMP